MSNKLLTVTEYQPQLYGQLYDQLGQQLYWQLHDQLGEQLCWQLYWQLRNKLREEEL